MVRWRLMATRVMHNIGVCLAWVLLSAGGIIFIQGRVLFLFFPARWGMKDSIGNGLIASFLVAIPLIAVGGALQSGLGKKFLPLRSEEEPDAGDSGSSSTDT